MLGFGFAVTNNVVAAVATQQAAPATAGAVSTASASTNAQAAGTSKS